MFNFTFLKPYYSEVEILELFNISKSTLQRYREECLKMGGNLFEDMGYFHINGTKSAMYEPVKFSNWLLRHKINLPKTYTYEVEEKKKLQDGLIKFPQYQSKKEGVN